MKKILIAEDDHFLAKVYQAKFSKAGFEIQMAKDGVEALEILAKFVPDLILLDLVMPRKDGFAVLSELKKSDQWKKIPVIVTTNLSQPEDKEKVKAMGASEYIIKSDVSIAEIVEKVINFTNAH